MGYTTAAGTALAISAATPATFDATGYAALTYTEVGSVEKIGGIGSTFAKVEFQPLKGAKQKFKGSVDYGSLAPSMALDPADAGQILMNTAAANITQTLYSFKVTLQDATVRYFQGRVFGFQETPGSATNVLMATSTVEITTVVIKNP